MRFTGKPALVAFIGLSLTSLFADVAYEGARSVSGPYLGYLGAGALIAGALSVGDLVAHTARVAGGLVAYKSGRVRVYWLLLFTGYTVNLVVVPLLALAGHWWEAFALYVIERVGKGLRTVPRDSILASISQELGGRRGLIFSLHEVVDQVGAVSGPLIVAAALGAEGSYAVAFAVLAVPAAAALASLAMAYRAYPDPRVAAPGGSSPGIPGWAKLLAAASGLGMAALMHWSLAGYTLASSGMTPERVAVLFSIAMAADALAAIPIGVLYDRAPRAALALGPPASAAATAMLANHADPVASAAAWGIAMAFYETAFKASAARAPPESRTAVYTLMFASMGIGWTLGNMLQALLLGDPAILTAAAAALGAAGALAALKSER